ncbi:MAG TPA: penicillin-binding protein 1B, partial [Gammaproteobacteria bacterium]|nr:penicillin-binding protein 1B [Gammaproteobacteria bacterium]
ALMSLLLEWRYDKDEILEAYLNEIYLGQDGNRAIHGFGLAAQFYFDAPLNTLNSGQIALLVGLVKGPGYYDPRRFAKRAKQRRKVVLKTQQKLGLLPAETVRRLAAGPLGVSKNKPSGVTRYPAFMDLVKRQLVKDYRPEDLSSEGLRLFTTINPWQQHALEQSIKRQLPALDEKSKLKKGELQVAAMLSDTGSAAVRAMVGSRYFRSQGFNRVLDARRHVGSLIKPAVYLTALGQPGKYNLITHLQDSPIRIKQNNGKFWEPQNYDHKFHGEISLMGALANSYNAATVRLGMKLGLENVGQTLQALGIRRDIDLYPSMLLGAVDLSMLEILQMYQTLSEQGIQTPIRAIHTVTTANGRVLSKYPIQVQKTIEAESVYLLLRAMEEVAISGTARYARHKLGHKFTIAGKTGTTNDYKDSWFAGITGDKVAVVWLGNDDNKPIGLTGSSGALRIWTDVIQKTARRSLDIPVPARIRFAKVDVLMQNKAALVCANDIVLPFVSGYVPKSRSGVACVDEQ